MRRILTATGLLALVIAAAGFGGSADRAGSSGSISEAQVCSAASFSVDGARCIADERAGVTTSTLHCSARVRGLAGASYTGAFRFRGQSFPVQTGIVPGDGWVYTSLAIKGGTFPAGPWSCSIRAGESKASVVFSTAGSKGPATSVAACPTSVTVLSSNVRACRDDRSDRPFAPTSAVTCSGVYALAKGHTASARLLFKGKPTGLSLARPLPLPVSVFGMQVAKKGGLPAGPYACEFSLDGKKVATRPFAISSAPQLTPPTRG